MIGVIVVLGILSLIYFLKPKMKPFHVDIKPVKMMKMGFDIFPLIHFMMSVMPDSMRKSSVTKQNAPKSGGEAIRDRFDLTGKTPYKIEELKPGKIWQVTYDTENKSLTSKKAKEEAKAFGMDPSDEAYQEKCLKAAALHGDEMVEVAKKDLETAKYWSNKETITDEEIIEAGPNQLNSFVIKLNSGSLLLYAPVRIRDEVGFGDWLATLGKVEWIVVASAYHTLNIKAVAERYPDAKIIGAPAAEAKLNFIDALVRKKFDFVCTDADQMKEVNSLLSNEGASLFCVDGDTSTNSLFLVAHGVGFECDLIYGHHDGIGIFTVPKDEFLEFKPEHWGIRLFKFALVSKPNSPFGFLPEYRFLMMDPNNFGPMTYDKPKADGSSCKEMANSLRKLLKLEFESATGVHIKMQSKEDFKQNINSAWNWLDGKPLI